MHDFLFPENVTLFHGYNECYLKVCYAFISSTTRLLSMHLKIAACKTFHHKHYFQEHLTADPCKK